MSSILLRTFFAASAVGFALVVALPGCSDDDKSETPPANTADGGDGSATDDSQCKSQGESCSDCCLGAHLVGFLIFDRAQLNCVCDGACRQVCTATLCAPQSIDADDACGKCIDETSACDAKILEECNKDADCIALRKCVDSCPK